MKFIPTPIHGAYVVELEPRSDERGMFARSFCRKEFEAQGLPTDFVQENVSFCVKRGTIRGLHWQAEPHGEAKFFRCTRGRVFEAIVDMRPESPTKGQWFGVELDAESRRRFFVPAGCANGYQSLEDGSEVTYAVSALYHPESERGVRWDDPSFNIAWPIRDNIILSPKDAAWPDVSV
jgi:dTDP-4-dehydrorhamnose 3,5-epimerase